MDRQQIGLQLALRAVGLDLSLSNFRDRLVLQKTVYLVQASGVDLGYSYGWYLRGPYSRDLTRDAYSLQTELEQNVDDWKTWSLDAKSKTLLERLKPLLDDHDPKGLELVASVHFLLKTRQGKHDDVSGLRTILRANKKDFEETEIEKALEDLSRYGLLPAQR